MSVMLLLSVETLLYFFAIFPYNRFDHLYFFTNVSVTFTNV